MTSSALAIMCVSAEAGCYIFVNEAFARMIGKPLCQVMAGDPYRVWIEATHPDDIGPEREALDRLAKGEIDRYQIEKRFCAGSLEPRWYRADITATRGPSGQVAILFGFFTDIHEQRVAVEARARLEMQLRQTQKLDALGKLAGGVAHDFNNRLLIILGYTELLTRELPEGSPLSSHAEMVLASAQRGAELTRQLLAYSRRQVLKPEQFDLNQTVDGMRRMLERLIGDHIELVTSLAASKPVFSDPGQIEQVILNLAINARDAMPGGGRLTLETRDVKLLAHGDLALPAGDYVVIGVYDTGIGIPDDVIPHIFEPFFTTKEVGRGTGLGLSMVEGIVKQSGGAVRVTTRVGMGTRFTVHLPCAHEFPAPRYRVVDAPPRNLDVETVLVCDDDDDVRRLLVDVLNLRGYRILEARQGRHALDVAAQHNGPIHLLVTDVVMPQLDGIELATALRNRDPGLLVIYMSGYAEDADRLSDPLGPHTRFLAKPFLPGDLTRAVFAMLKERSGGDPDP
jgi:signal transduction histidine kinase/ActR/RegA family two-component response regulator